MNIAQAGVIADAPNMSEAFLKAFSAILSIAGVIAIISIVLSGILYLTSNGNEKRLNIAKKALKNSIIGTIIVFGALIILMTLNYFIN